MGKALTQWQRDFEICYSIITPDKRKEFPSKFARFLGYTIYNAKRRADSPNDWKLAKAHYNHAQQIPFRIKKHIDEKVREHLSEEMVITPIGNDAVMHTHNTPTNMAQKYRKPIWGLTACDNLESTDKPTIMGNRQAYESTKEKYEKFAEDFLERIATLNDW